MNTISKITGLIALASASVGAALLFSTPANAFANANAATLQQKCFGSSKTLVERCCNSWVQSHGRPIWMWDTNTSCGQAAGCSAAAPKKALFAAPSAAPSAAPASKAMIINRVRINKKLKDVCGIDIPTSVSHSSKEPPQSIAPVPPPTSATGSLTHGKP